MAGTDVCGYRFTGATAMEPVTGSAKPMAADLVDAANEKWQKQCTQEDGVYAASTGNAMLATMGVALGGPVLLEAAGSRYAAVAADGIRRQLPALAQEQWPKLSDPEAVGTAIGKALVRCADNAGPVGVGALLTMAAEKLRDQIGKLFRNGQ